jgi:hypothetical protein
MLDGRHPSLVDVHRRFSEEQTRARDVANRLLARLVESTTVERRRHVLRRQSIVLHSAEASARRAAATGALFVLLLWDCDGLTDELLQHTTLAVILQLLLGGDETTAPEMVDPLMAVIETLGVASLASDIRRYGAMRAQSTLEWLVDDPEHVLWSRAKEPKTSPEPLGTVVSATLVESLGRLGDGRPALALASLLPLTFVGAASRLWIKLLALGSAVHRRCTARPLNVRGWLEMVNAWTSSPEISTQLHELEDARRRRDLSLTTFTTLRTSEDDVGFPASWHALRKELRSLQATQHLGEAHFVEEEFARQDERIIRDLRREFSGRHELVLQLRRLEELRALLLTQLAVIPLLPECGVVATGAAVTLALQISGPIEESYVVSQKSGEGQLSTARVFENVAELLLNLGISVAVIERVVPELWSLSFGNGDGSLGRVRERIRETLRVNFSSSAPTPSHNVATILDRIRTSCSEAAAELRDIPESCRNLSIFLTKKSSEATPPTDRDSANSTCQLEAFRNLRHRIETSQLDARALVKT